MGTCSPWPPLEEFKGSWRDQNSSNFGKNTHSTHGKWKGIILSTTTQMQLFVSPLALNKEGRGRSCSGSPLGSSGVTCTRPGYNHTGFISAIWLLHIGNDPWGAEESMAEVLSPGHQGGAWLRADQGVHPSFWSGEGTRCPRTVELWALSWLGIPELSAFPSFRQHLFDISTWIRYPRTCFSQSHKQIWKHSIAKLALEAGALFAGRAPCSPFPAVSSGCNTSYTGKKSPSSAATSSVAAAAHTEVMCMKEEYLGEWDCGTPMWTVLLGLRCLYHHEAHGVGLLDIYQIFDTRYLTNHLNPKGFWLKAFKTSSLLPKQGQKVSVSPSKQNKLVRTWLHGSFSLLSQTCRYFWLLWLNWPPKKWEENPTQAWAKLQLTHHLADDQELLTAFL